MLPKYMLRRIRHTWIFMNKWLPAVNQPYLKAISLRCKNTLIFRSFLRAKASSAPFSAISPAVKNLEVRNDLLAAVVQSSEDAILSYDLQGIVTSWNQAAEKIYGYSEKEILGKSVFLIVPKEKMERSRTIFRSGHPRRSTGTL